MTGASIICSIEIDVIARLHFPLSSSSCDWLHRCRSCCKASQSGTPEGRRLSRSAVQHRNSGRRQRKTAIAPHSISIAMALQEVTASLLRRLRTQNTALSQVSGLQCRRNASSDSSVAREIQDLEETDFVKASEPNTKYDPLHRSRSFEGTPPSSRYVEALLFAPASYPKHSLTIYPDTSSVLPSTTAVLCTLTNLPNPPTRPRASSFPVLSLSRASNKPTPPLSKPIS
jgi:hypothetical protein